MEELNWLSLERLQLVCDYTNLAVQLENHLASIRFGISKARTLRGVVLSNLFNIDAQTLTPSTWFTVDGDDFALVDQSMNVGNEEKQPIHRRKGEGIFEEQDRDKGEVRSVSTFRPFGILEPIPAKEARISAHLALQIVCEMASMQCRIKKIDDKIMDMKDKLKEEKQIREKFDEVIHAVQAVQLKI